MAAPTPVKTWQIVPNILVSGDPDEHTHAQDLMFAIHSSLLGFALNPWAVNYSCDSTAPGTGVPDDGVDHWVAATDIVWSTGAHSWCVYDLPAGAQILFDFDFSTSNCEDANVLVSPGALFTGGDANNRPTAIDEETFIMQTSGASETWWSGQITGGAYCNVDNRIQIWHSSDGLATRLLMYRDSVCNCIWEFGDMGDKRAGQADPFVWGIMSSGAIGHDVTLTNYIWVHEWLNSYDSGAAYQMKLMGLAGGPLAARKLWTEMPEANIAEEIDSELHGTTVHLWGVTVGARGWKGTLVDCWLSPHQALNPGDNSPNTPASRDFVHCNSIMLPWIGDATVMLIA